MSWRDFWNGDNAIYVSPRHKALHYRQIARDIVGFIPAPDAIVLDHGCGEALSADIVATACLKLYLCEAAPTVRDKLRAAFGHLGKINVVSPEEVAALPDAGLDLVVANSLIQYLKPEELTALLALWRAKLKPGGHLVLADVIPPDLGPLSDASHLLAFAWRGGFLKDALAGLVRTAFSDYRKLRAQYGLSTHTEEGITALIAQAGFEAIERVPNFGHNPQRMTFRACLPVRLYAPMNAWNAETPTLAERLVGTVFPAIGLPSTSGRNVDLASLGAGRTVLYCYPRTSVPGTPPPADWDIIPGARGCTPQACAFRDHYAELTNAGASVFGLSTQSTSYQQEMASRLHLPFEILSDEQFRLCDTLSLPTFVADGMRLIERLTLIVRDGRVEHVFHPVGNPETSAEETLRWLIEHPI